MPDPRHLLGERAEAATAAWLAARGWTVLARRWRGGAGELDIVAIDPIGTLVAIEVKLRRTGRAGGPLEAISRRRLRRQRAALTAFRAAMATGPRGQRIDLVAVRPAGEGRGRLTHLPAIDEW